MRGGGRVWPGRKVVLAPLRDDHRQTVGLWMRDPETARLMGTGGGPWDFPPPQSERLCMAINTRSGRLIGYLALRDVSWRLREAELHMCIGEKDFWGQGMGADALCTYLGYIFSTTRLLRLYLRVYADNARAVRCYRKCGFGVRGILRAGARRERGFRDLLLMEVSRDRAAGLAVAGCLRGRGREDIMAAKR
ncbi:MAG: GNAT family N-acetyltransferase [Bacillota bacterium]